MASQKNLTALLLGLMMMAGGCSTDPGTTGGGGDDDDTSNPGGGSDGTGMTDPGPLTTPVFPTAHPRIYLSANRSRLMTALNGHTAAATRFKSVVDRWLGGEDIWGF